MRVISGRFAEVRCYLWHCLAVLRPGTEVPVFHEPSVFTGDLSAAAEDQLKLVVEEGRRQLDRQAADLERMRARATTLVTVGLAEIALLSNGARAAFRSTWPVTAAWTGSALLAVLGIAGAVAVLTARAVLGRTDTRDTALEPSPRLPKLASEYAQATGEGESTVATRLTVLRDAVLLLVLGALLYAAAWPFYY
jgi:hypothetical protein